MDTLMSFTHPYPSQEGMKLPPTKIARTSGYDLGSNAQSKLLSGRFNLPLQQRTNKEAMSIKCNN
ncbi:hypothetical protein [Phocaeicola sp.]